MVLAEAEFSRGDLRGQAGPNDGRNVFCPGAPAGFLFAAVNQRVNPCASMAVKNTDSFRAVKAMRRDGDQVRAESLDIEWHPTGAGNGIDKQGNTSLARNLRDFGNGLDRADVVVGEV